MNDGGDIGGGAAALEERDVGMRFEALDVTPELLAKGLTLWGGSLDGTVAARLAGRFHDLLEVEWHVWPATIRVTEISVSTEPRTLPVAGLPPEVTWARVSIFGSGFRPGVPVEVKWNNAVGFPDNGVGSNSILLQSPVPDAHGRFAYQVIHRGKVRAAQDWLWEANRQLVLVAQQGLPGDPDYRYADQRYIPPHLLWQWVPHPPTNAPG
jgi:hypothetical protein